MDSVLIYLAKGQSLYFLRSEEFGGIFVRHCFVLGEVF